MSKTPRTLTPLFEELRGERVLLRPYHSEDAQALYEAIHESRDHIRPWLPFADAHQNVDESRDWIIHQEAEWLLRTDMNMSIWDISTQHFLGGTGFHPRNWESRYFEIGYWLRVSAPGHGYMTEAARLLNEFCFEQLSANRVEIRCDERNTRSANVARRLGFVQEGCLRQDMRATDGTLRNTLIFSMIPADRGK